MAVAQISASLSLSIRDASGIIPAAAAASPARLPLFNSNRIGTVFSTGSPLIIRTAYHQRKAACRSMPLSIRCEQSTKGGGLDVWLGRLAMIGFASAISVEVATGKGLLEALMLYRNEITSYLTDSREEILIFPHYSEKELWAYESPAYSCLGCDSTGGSSNSSFHFPVWRRKLNTV